MDPLTVLRDFVIDKRIDDIIESADGTRILFADRKSFPKVRLDISENITCLRFCTRIHIYARDDACSLQHMERIWHTNLCWAHQPLLFPSPCRMR